MWKLLLETAAEGLVWASFSAEPMMTVAAKDGMPTGGGGRRVRLARGAAGNPWKRLWQVPLFLAGAAAFGLGARALVRTIRPVPFEEQAKGVRSLLAAGEYSKAVDQINVLGDYYKSAAAQGELEELAGDAHFLAEQKELADGSILVPTNYQWTEKHYAAAVRLGVVPTVAMNERWGIAAMGVGEADVAAEKLEAAIGGAGPKEQAVLLEKHGKDLVAAYLQAGQMGKALSMVDRMIAAQAQPGGNGGAQTEPTDEANARVLDALEEKTWGLCTRIQIALLSKDRKGLAEAVSDARQALEGLKEHDPMGRVLVWIGRAELEQGDMEAAERDLSRARSLFAVHHLDDGRAAVLLARIAQQRGDTETAGRLYGEVVTSEAGTSVWAAARLGRADVMALQKGEASKEVVADYRYAMEAASDAEHAGLGGGGGAPVGQVAELIRMEDVRTGLHEAYQAATKRDQLDDALTFLAMEKETGGPETAEMAYDLATTNEKRGDEMHAQAEQEEAADRDRDEAQARQLWATAAAAYLRHAKLTTLDDETSGASSWKGAELLDRAGRAAAAIAVYERLTIQRPRDSRVSEGMLALGRLYESAGMMEKAVATYKENIERNAKTPAAYGSAVDLARCYAEMGEKESNPEEKEKDYAAAETALLGLVLDNPDLKPEAKEFREGVRALGELYYQRGRWADAILRLSELLERYPSDPGVPHALFLLGESYRKSAGEIGAALEKNAGMANRAELEQAWKERLHLAMDDFTRVIGLLDAAALGESATAPAKAPTVLEEECLKTAYMERGDCAYALGDYGQAIKFYEQASARFSEDRLAVEAYVQIVNAYLALKKPAEAGAAAERGQFVLKRIPDKAFAGGGQGAAAGGGADRAYYEKLLALGKS